tara:strand:+ start:164 stop:421 length:258 start_codon:yes stop_codon:yes gene_type:complete
MKISEFTDNNHIDEISAGEIGTATGKAARAVGSGIKNFAKGFASGVKGQATANPALDSIKVSIAKLNPKQKLALRKQLAKKAGVA